MVDEVGQGCKEGGLLPTPLCGCGGEEREGLAVQGLLLPQLPCGVPEGLELRRQVAEPAAEQPLELRRNTAELCAYALGHAFVGWTGLLTGHACTSMWELVTVRTALLGS